MIFFNKDKSNLNQTIFKSSDIESIKKINDLNTRITGLVSRAISRDKKESLIQDLQTLKDRIKKKIDHKESNLFKRCWGYLCIPFSKNYYSLLRSCLSDVEKYIEDFSIPVSLDAQVTNPAFVAENRDSEIAESSVLSGFLEDCELVKEGMQETVEEFMESCLNPEGRSLLGFGLGAFYQTAKFIGGMFQGGYPGIVEDEIEEVEPSPPQVLSTEEVSKGPDLTLENFLQAMSQNLKDEHKNLKVFVMRLFGKIENGFIWEENSEQNGTFTLTFQKPSVIKIEKSKAVSLIGQFIWGASYFINSANIKIPKTLMLQFSQDQGNAKLEFLGTDPFVLEANTVAGSKSRTLSSIIFPKNEQENCLLKIIDKNKIEMSLKVPFEKISDCFS